MTKTVYLIVGTERSGSSLLASLLASAGANFNMPMVDNWYRGSGAYEHPEYIRLLKHVKRSLFFKKYSDRLAHKEQQKAINIAKTFFKNTTFVKYPPYSEHVAHIVKAAGFQPRLILTCRRFNDYLKSNIIKGGETFDFHKNNYMNVNQTCFAQLFIYGGCIITYDELVDLNQGKWAIRLEEVTQLSSKILLDKRYEKIKVYGDVNIIPELDTSVSELYNLINKYSSKVFNSENNKLH